MRDPFAFVGDAKYSFGTVLKFGRCLTTAARAPLAAEAITSVTTSPAPKATPSEAFTAQGIAAYIGDHLIEAAALFATLAAALSYAVGRSYLDGWAQAAGIPPSLFQSDVHDAILTGVKLPRVWLSACVGMGIGFIVCAVTPKWWEGRRRNWTLRDRALRMGQAGGWGQSGLRFRLAGQAFLLRNHSDEATNIAYRRWRTLGPRRARTTGKRERRVYHLVIAVSLATVGMTCTFVSIYKLLDSSFIAPARREGIVHYAKVYLAVTGHLPYQFGRNSLSVMEQREWACEGRSILSQYRAVTLAPDIGAAEPPETFYVIQGVDKLFVLLGTKGSVLRSFGDAPFVLKESSTRLYSHIAEDC